MQQKTARRERRARAVAKLNKCISVMRSIKLYYEDNVQIFGACPNIFEVLRISMAQRSALRRAIAKLSNIGLCKKNISSSSVLRKVR
jgi:hypothetical protein